jgi:hypothetical protein
MLQSLSDMKTTRRLSNLDRRSKLPHWQGAAVLAILLLAAQSGATPHGFGLSRGHSLKVPSLRAHPAFQLQPDRTPAQASGGQSQEIPKTFVDMSPAELAKALPELKHLEPAENQDMLPQILKSTGAAVAAFFDNFPNTACTERVSSNVDSHMKVGALHYDNKYNYVALAQAGAQKGRLKEYRTDANGVRVEPDAKTGVVTFGFVALSVHFHPDYQPESIFRYLGRESVEKQNTYVVAFAQRPNLARQTASVNFFGRHGIVYVQGLAWIDPGNFRILRIRTDLERPETNVGLLKETTQVLYSEVSFVKGGKTMYLPHEVTVSGELGQYLFHNQHRYSDYRLFKVAVEEKRDNQ